MKLRGLLIASAVMSFTFVSANALEPTVPSPLIVEDKVIRSAYYDTLGILSSSNECSEFFGGPTKSVEIFNVLMGRIRKEFLFSSIAMRMSGQTIDAYSMITRTKYRLFDKVSININGPFYRHRYSETQPIIPGVGTFQPNTREARVLMFLHELGHVVQVEEGKWLLPDDGRDEELSRKNTRTIEGICGSEIRKLDKRDTEENSVSGKQQDEPPTQLELKS